MRSVSIWNAEKLLNEVIKMKKLGLNEIREKYLTFFESKEHLRLESYSLVPENDPSILLINAGMTPLKPYFTGEQTPPSKRITTCQKCIRTLDIENVGKTSRHGTFFEMLGNFSFGDYFKREAIFWAWEFITEVMEMPLSKLYISVYEEDDETYSLWNNEVGIPSERLVRLGKADNFWEHGVGPCGPCSEIYFDRGPESGCDSPDCQVGCDCDRYVEFWNLVFTQFNRNEEGVYEKLPNPNIDTGMGLERLACVMQGVNSLFEVDTIKNVLDYICRLAGATYGESRKTDVSLRVITDHIRSTTMLVSDGVIPSNEGRGYILRRLLRRAARHARLLGIKERFLSDVAQIVIKESCDAYPELNTKSDYIKLVISKEEERFDKTVDSGLQILNDLISKLKSKGENRLSGLDVFKLHDTFGFPFDLTREIAEENTFSIDENEFKSEMDNQRNMAREALKSKAGSAWGENLFAGLNIRKTEFLGYQSLNSESKVLAILKDDKIVDELNEGESGIIVLDQTPFYAESGGQVGDVGLFINALLKAEVTDTKKTPDGLYLHVCNVISGNITTSEAITALVNVEMREATCRNHTVTHILQKALKEILGDHIEQAGSFVDPFRIRFDFQHFSPMSDEEIRKVEKRVNSIILSSLEVDVQEMSLQEARNSGATALFGEKYGDPVRVISVGDYSKELCGGTHLKNSSTAGLIKILSETGVAAGVRRIEALTGLNAISYLYDREDTLLKTANILKTPIADVLKKTENLVLNQKDLEKQLSELKTKFALTNLDEILNNSEVIKGISIVIGRFDEQSPDNLRNLAERIRSIAGESVVFLIGENDGKVNLVSMASKMAVQHGIHCGEILKEAAAVCGGGGGGRPDMAQAGGKDASKINYSLDVARKRINIQLECKGE